MKINRLEIGSFGKFKNYQLEFGDGLHILFGNNEYGKSTIMNFIYLMFYGGAKTVKAGGTVNLRKLYAPWDGEKMSGAIVFEHKGTGYRLEKVFNKSKATDIVNLWNQSSGEKEIISKGDDIGSLFFDMGPSAFEKSVFIGNAGVIGSDDDISSKLSNLITNGDERISPEKVLKNITDGKFQLISKSKKTGAIIEQRDQAEALKVERNQAILLEEEKKKIEEKLLEKQQLLNALNKEIDAYKENEKTWHAVKEYHKIKDYVKKYKELEGYGNHRFQEWISEEELEKAESWNGAAQDLKKIGDYIKDNLLQEEGQYKDTLRQLEEVENKLQQETNRLSGLGDESKNLKEKVQDLKDLEVKKTRILAELSVAELNTHEYEAISEQKIKIQRERIKSQGSKKIQSLMISAIIGILSIIIGIRISSWGYLGLVVSFIIIISSFFKKSADHNKIEKFIKEEEGRKIAKRQELERKRQELKTVARNMEELIPKIENLTKIKNTVDEHLKVRESAKADADRMRSTIEIRKSRLAKMNKEFKQEEDVTVFLKKKEEELVETERALQFLFMKKNCCSIEALRALRKDTIKRENERKNLDQLKEAYGLEKDSFEEILKKLQQAEEILVEKEGALEKELWEEELEKQNEKIKENKSRIVEINLIINQLNYDKGELNSKVKDINELDDNLEELSKRLSEMEYYYDSLEIAEAELEASMNELRSTFGPMVNHKTGKIFNKLTNGRYGDVRVSKNFAITALETGQIISHDSEYLSSGTLDQAYLSLRLAITELLTKDGLKLPVLLDDVLMQYDDKRTKEGLKFLSEYSKGQNGEENRQVLLFTCHGNIFKWCKDNLEHVRNLELV